MSAHVELKGVTKRFGKVTAVDRIGLAIPKGEFVALLGASGARHPAMYTLALCFHSAENQCLTSHRGHVMVLVADVT